MAGHRILLRLAVLFLVGAAGMAFGAGTGEAAETVSIGYLEIDGDPRYEKPRAYAGIDIRPRHRPFAGAKAGVREGAIIGRAVGVSLEIERIAAPDAAGLTRVFDRLHDQGTRFFIVDGPAAALSVLAAHAAGRDALLFNVAEPDDALRNEACAANLVHTLPSRAMLADAMAQFLVSRRWNDVLLLRGPEALDNEIADAFTRSARKFGLTIVAKRDFVLSNDPRQRGRNNVILLTTGIDYDAVFVADNLGEFGRYVAYGTALPRPVVGTEGLMASAWHWSWERHGAPQLNKRFERRAGRRMGDADWASWIAVKAIVEALARTRSTAFADLAAFLKGGRLTLDGYKGPASSFRPWNNQLRQPILLHSYNAVLARAPIEGFLHPTQYMDTVGADRPESRCRFDTDKARTGG